jgi:hypothetical protein
MPYLKAGNRYILDIEQVEEHLKSKAIANMKAEEKVVKMGVLRKVSD